ncbi:MAG: EFR1 family ferrodoxin [Schwartzia sp.]|nr:EFR1 family ferrodoxin [Schwartzia sp. (in: firmicutes)]
MKTVIFYLSATGNSLYVARFLQSALGDTALRSIPEALADGRFAVEADVVGIVFPLHYMGLPLQVEALLERLEIAGTPYLFAIATCGVPYIGTPFVDAADILTQKGHHWNAAWYLRLVSNYLPLRDTAADWRIRIRAWLAERKLRKIAGAIAKREPHRTWQLLQQPCRRLHREWKERQQRIDENFHCDTGKCTACGLCERVCPTGNIARPDGHPVWQHRCTECLGCLHICPTEAIDYGEKTKGRHRYRHKDIAPKDLLHHFAPKEDRRL